MRERERKKQRKEGRKTSKQAVLLLLLLLLLLSLSLSFLFLVNLSNHRLKCVRARGGMAAVAHVADPVNFSRRSASMAFLKAIAPAAEMTLRWLFRIAAPLFIIVAAALALCVHVLVQVRASMVSYRSIIVYGNARVWHWHVVPHQCCLQLCHVHSGRPTDGRRGNDAGRALGGASEDNFCKKCDKVKAPRSMHCFVCNKCIVGMDHHCPWIAQCVGCHNHHYFFLFLMYTTLGCLYVALWARPAWWEFSVRHIQRSGLEYSQRLALTLMTVLPASLCVCVGGMMIWHGYILLTAQTSPEFAVNMLEMRQTPGGICKWASKYDSGGFKENWKNVFCVEDHRFWYLAWAMPYIRSRSMKNVLGSRRGHRTGDGRGIYRVV